MSIATVRHAAPRRAVAGITLLASLALLSGAASANDPTERAQHVELPEIGVAADFPAGWQVRTPLQPRESWYDVSIEDDTPVYAWAGVFATGGNGRWCGIDRFEDFPWTLDEHAAFLERWHVSASLSGRDGGYAAVALPAGPAWRIDVHDERKGRTSVLYLLGHDDDHVLLFCADELRSDEDWLAIAESIELGPRSAVAPEVMAATLDAIHADE